MTRLVRSAAAAVVLGLVALGCGDGSRTNPVAPQQKKATASESTSVTSQVRVPIEMVTHVLCPPDSLGDTVTLSGDLHLQSHTNSDGNGGVHVVEMHVNPQGLSGVGSSGNTYRGSGVTHESFRYVDGQTVTHTLVVNFLLISQGSAPNFIVHQVVHITVNANGELTASVGSTEVDCR